MQANVVIKKVKNKGLAVFANKNFKIGEVIEVCPILVITPKERKFLDKTILAYYLYPYKSTRSGSLVLGYGSIYNHAYNPNADWKQNFKKSSMIYTAVKPIKKGEEITVNYNGEPDDTKPIDWFEVR